MSTALSPRKKRCEATGVGDTLKKGATTPNPVPFTSRNLLYVLGNHELMPEKYPELGLFIKNLNEEVSKIRTKEPVMRLDLQILGSLSELDKILENKGDKEYLLKILSHICMILYPGNNANDVVYYSKIRFMFLAIKYLRHTLDSFLIHPEHSKKETKAMRDADDDLRLYKCIEYLSEFAKNPAVDLAEAEMSQSQDLDFFDTLSLIHLKYGCVDKLLARVKELHTTDKKNFICQFTQKSITDINLFFRLLSEARIRLSTRHYMSEIFGQLSKITKSPPSDLQYDLLIVLLKFIFGEDHSFISDFLKSFDARKGTDLDSKFWSKFGNQAYRNELMSPYTNPLPDFIGRDPLPMCADIENPAQSAQSVPAEPAPEVRPEVQPEPAPAVQPESLEPEEQAHECEVPESNQCQVPAEFEVVESAVSVVENKHSDVECAPPDDDLAKSHDEQGTDDDSESVETSENHGPCGLKATIAYRVQPGSASSSSGVGKPPGYFFDPFLQFGDPSFVYFPYLRQQDLDQLTQDPQGQMDILVGRISADNEKQIDNLLACLAIDPNSKKKKYAGVALKPVYPYKGYRD